MTGIERGAAKVFVNEHRSITLPMDRTARLVDAGSEPVQQWLAERGAVLRQFLAEEHAASHRLCAIGSGWSQSPVYRSGATLLDTVGDAAIFPLPDAAFRDGVSGRHRYVLVSGGAKVGSLMAWLEAQEPALSLATAGSHKGQSVAGMLATGSHGSMLGRSGFECHVRGILLAWSAGPAQWFAGDPVLRDAFVTQFAAIADPALFSAALVHLGGLGLVSAVLLECEEDFRLGRTKRMRVLPPDWAELCGKDDFTGAIGGNKTPAYYEVTLDPFRGIGHEALETIWFANAAAGLTDMADPGDSQTLDLLAEAVTRELETSGGDALAASDDEALLLDVPFLTWLLFKRERVEEPNAAYRLSQLVGDWKPRTLGPVRVDVYNAAFAVPLERLPDALAIAFEVAAEASPIRRDYVFTVRFARRSPAEMGFLRFENTAVINIDGLAKGFLSSTSHQAALELARRFEAASLPFSMHWGKDAPSPANKIAHDFGPAVQRWKAARAAVLGDDAALFASPALSGWGLV